MISIIQLKTTNGDIRQFPLMQSACGMPVIPARGDRVLYDGITYEITHALWYMTPPDIDERRVTVYGLAVSK